MANERDEAPPGKGGRGAGDGNRWKYPVAALVIVGMLLLVAYVTVTTGHIPVEVALPLIFAAGAAMFGFKLSDWRGGQ